MKPTALILSLMISFNAGAQAPTTAAPAANPPANPGRVASVFLSESFVNAQLRQRVKSDLVKDPKIEFNADEGVIYFRGLLQLPIEELKAINLDPSLGAFRFQSTIKPRASKKNGFLVLEFPLNKTFFYAANSKHPQRDRVYVPVQLLSLALASLRGYLAALSGDFSGFDRRAEKLKALSAALDHSISREKNPDAREEMKNQRESIRLQLEAIPLERKQLQALAKQVQGFLGFAGEKEINLGDDLGGWRNAIIFKVKISQLVPYLDGATLGGIRIKHDKKDGNGENYLVVDINSDMITATPTVDTPKRQPRPGMKIPPDMIIRLNQALFESQALLKAEKDKMSSSIRDIDMELKEDGLHIEGKWHKFFVSIPFDAIVDLTSRHPDTFSIRVRDLDIAGLDVDFLSGFILQAMQSRFEQAMKGACTFEYKGERKDHSRALKVTVDTKKMLPAFPDLHLVNIDIREREFVLKMGRVEEAAAQ